MLHGLQPEDQHQIIVIQQNKSDDKVNTRLHLVRVLKFLLVTLLLLLAILLSTLPIYRIVVSYITNCVTESLIKG